MRTVIQQVWTTIRRLLRGTPAATTWRRRRAVEAVRSSELFDDVWYLEQLGGKAPPGDLVEHYVDVGAAEGMSPSPLFDSDWYVSTHPKVTSSRYPPFAEYLLAGSRRGDAPHPAFDANHYLREHPEARSFPGGVLGHYCRVGVKSNARPHPRFDARAYERAHPGLTEPPFLHLVRAAARVLRDTKGYWHLPRLSDTFDVAASDRWKRAVRAAWQRVGVPSPKVSVIMPTRDRATEVVAAARSVLDQSYRNFQLIIVDDGSRDGTVEALAHVRADPRVEYIRRDVSGGVAAARNAGLARARGKYVAYLDSDNTWSRDFLELMVAFLSTSGYRAGYCVSELRGKDKHQFRGMPFHYAALLEQNYIDCIVLVHERSLLDEVGYFDESLRRMVDWELLIRIGAATDLGFAPFLGTTYDLWEARPDRISSAEPWGHRYVILARRLLDWESMDVDREPGSTSALIVAAARDPEGDFDRCLSRLLKYTPSDVEIVIVDPGSVSTRYYEFQMLAAGDPRVRVLRYSEKYPFELAANLGLAHSRGENVVLLSSDLLVEPGWLPPLVAALRNGAAAAGPLFLQPSGTVASAGVEFAGNAVPVDLMRGHAGESAEASQPGERAGLRSAGLAVRAEDLIKIRGIDVFYVNALDSPDLSLRLAGATGRPLRYVPASIIVQLDPKQDRAATKLALDNRRHFLERWNGVIRPGADHCWNALGFSVLGYLPAPQAGVPDQLTRFQPILVHERPGRLLRWAIKMAAPDLFDREGWGDHYFARGLKDALMRRGHEAVIDCAAAWYRNSGHLDEVTLVLRGRKPYVPNPAHTTLLWLISHPDLLDPSEIVSCDYVFVASVPYASDLTRRFGRPVEPLLRCTDSYRFGPSEPEPKWAHPVLFVGNSGGIYRPAVRAAVAAGLDIAVYGRGWEGILDPGILRGTYIPNDELAGVYRAAGVVLNDHWDDMRRHGFISNRLFDAVACAARVVTDDVAGLSDLFGEVVACYRSPAELADIVRQQLSDIRADREVARLRLAEKVRSEHSFDARVGRLVEVVEQVRSQRVT